MTTQNIAKLLTLFELERGFTDSELKMAYRDLVQVWHPDKYDHNERLKSRAEGKIKEINEAYKTLLEHVTKRPKRRAAARPKSAGKSSYSIKKSFVKSVFHPTDLSQLSDVAFVHALRIAASAKGVLHLLHVTPENDKKVISEFPKISNTLKSWGVISEDCTKEELRELGFSYNKVVGFHDNPVKSILNYLEEQPADLTVLATGQRQGAERLMNKSVAEQVSRGSGWITLFIPGKSKGFVSVDSGEVNLKSVLIPIDNKPNPQLAVNAAHRFAELLGCEECLFVLVFIGDTSDMPLVDIPRRQGWEWKKTTRRGNVVEMINKVSEEHNTDLIVMSTQGHQGFLDALRGSTTEQVLRLSKCPVLTVPTYNKI